MTERKERRHGAIPAERRAFMWTTALLQVRDGAKWRKMTSSQAEQDPVPKQLFGRLIYSAGHLVQPLTAKLPPLSKPILERRRGSGDESAAGRDQAVGLAPIVNT